MLGALKTKRKELNWESYARVFKGLKWTYMHLQLGVNYMRKYDLGTHHNSPLTPETPPLTPENPPLTPGAPLTPKTYPITPKSDPTVPHNGEQNNIKIRKARGKS